MRAEGGRTVKEEGQRVLMPRERLTCATRPPAVRVRFRRNVKGHGGAAARGER